jgi:hypothetical protein
MIITVPSAKLEIKGLPLGTVVPARNEPVRYSIFEQNEFVNNVVYVDFARGPPIAA